MSDQGKKTALSTEGPVQTAPTTAKQDPVTARLAATGRAVGNGEMARRLGDGNVARDQMLAYVCDRLRLMRTIQLREVDQCDSRAQRDWIRKADGPGGTFEAIKPDPKRWHEPARLYKEASLALCRGSVQRGAEMLERAMAAEQEALSHLSHLVRVDDPETAAAQLDLGEFAPAQACGDCDVPADVALAHDIMDENTTTDIPSVPQRTRDPWWTEDEDEEKPEEPGG